MLKVNALNKKIIRLTLVSVASFFSLNANAECNHLIEGYTTCDMAKMVAKEGAKHLPMDISADISIRNIVAFGNVITYTTDEVTTRQEVFDLTKELKVSKKTLKSLLVANATNGLCGTVRSNDILLMFVNAGGVLKYTRSSSDNYLLYEYKMDKKTLSECPEAF